MDSYDTYNNINNMHNNNPNFFNNNQNYLNNNMNNMNNMNSNNPNYFNNNMNNKIKKIVSTRYDLNSEECSRVYINDIPAIKLGDKEFNFQKEDYGYKDNTATQAGNTVSVDELETYGTDAFFTCTPIPDSIFAFMQGRSFKVGCTIPRDSLRYIRCLHADKYGNSIIGEMVLNKSIAGDVLEIFRKLYSAKYPIERMLLIDRWEADDEMAMRDNNSSSFNFRFISHTQKVSKHGMGLAVDINTLYNPYHKFLADGTEIIEPVTGAPYLDRTKDFDYKIEKDDPCYKLFIAAGFHWGGDWENVKDYQHFEK